MALNIFILLLCCSVQDNNHHSSFQAGESSSVSWTIYKYHTLRKNKNIATLWLLETKQKCSHRPWLAQLCIINDNLPFCIHKSVYLILDAFDFGKCLGVNMFLDNDRGLRCQLVGFSCVCLVGHLHLKPTQGTDRFTLEKHVAATRANKDD